MQYSSVLKKNKGLSLIYKYFSLLVAVACSRRSDSGARSSERAGKKRGETVSPRFFPLFRSLSFSLALHYLNAWNRLL